MPTTQSLSLSQARRISLAAQQFAGSKPPPKNVAAFTNLVRALGVVQIDSVNVLVRSHYLPVFSRRGPYAPALLERAAYADHGRTLFEYWGHEASFLLVEMHRLFRWRMERALKGVGAWGRLRRYATEHRDLVANVLAQLRERGALGASELEGAGRSSGAWWGWSREKEILEWLFWSGQVTTARRRNFERLYDLPERVLPHEALAAPTPTEHEALRELLLIAARALGVATARDLRDYFRLPAVETKHALAELVREGSLESVEVEGWKNAAYLAPDAVCPRRVETSALLSPFDSLIWDRQRTERLFGFRYRLEIYTPAAKRVHGYYVLPFLCGEQLVARVDLKSDRERSRLQVRAGGAEQGVNASHVAASLLSSLRAMAAWLQLEAVEVSSRRGELMRELRKAMRLRSMRRRVTSG